MATRRLLFGLLLSGMLVGSAAQAGIPRLTVGFGCIMMGVVTGNQAWENYKSSAKNFGTAGLKDFIASNIGPVSDTLFGLSRAQLPYANHPQAQPVYRHLDRYQEAYKYGAASAACLGTGVYLLRKEFKTKSHHHKHDDCD